MTYDPHVGPAGNASLSLPLTGLTTVTTDADFTAGGPSRVIQQILHTGTLTANRTVTLSTAQARRGDRIQFARTGGGAFTLSIGGLKNLATNTWAVVAFDGTAWQLVQYGAL